MFYRARNFIAAAVCLLAAAGSARATILAPYASQASTGSATFTWNNPVVNYTAVLSTSPLFTAQVSTSATINVSTANYSFLKPNTTYYFKVKVDTEGAGGYSPAVSTATWVVAPTGIFSISSYFKADSSFTAIASIGWNTGSNPEWTNYDMAYSTSQDFTAGAIALFNNPPIDMGGLNSNTTYYFKVRARGVSNTVTAYASSTSAVTLAIKLTVLPDTVYETSTTVSWAAVNDPSIQALQSGGYRVNLYNDPSLANSIRTLTLPAVTVSTSLANLEPNTTYYYRAETLNLLGTPNETDARTFTTLSPKPQNLAITAALTDISATLGWTALSAVQTMGYRLEAATSNFTAGALILSSVSYRADLSTLTIPDLEPNTTYYFRVGSVNKNFVPNYNSAPSSVTLALPVSPDLAYVSAAPREITVSFIPMSEYPQAFACEGYRLEGSTNPAAWTGGGGAIISSVTYTYQDQLRSLTLPDLASNNTYYLRLGTLNWEHTPNYTILPSTKTGFPGPLPAVTLQVWNSSDTAGISFTRGISAEGHMAEASIYPYFNTIARSSFTTSNSATNLVISALDPNTVYYFRAGALYNGTTIYTNSVPEYRQTLPLQLTGLNLPAVFRSSITVAWTPLPNTLPKNTAESYLLEASTAPDFTSSVLFSSGTANVNLGTLTIPGLQPNTSYYFRAGTLNQEGAVNYALTPATSTLANPPVQSTFTVTPFTITLTWLTSSNPADTRYRIEMADNAGFLAPQPSSTTVLSSATFSGLSPNTTYYSRITAINRLNRSIPAVDFSPTATGAHDPTPLAFSNIGVSSVTLNWGPGANELLTTLYQAQVSSNTDFSGTVLSSVTLALSADFTGLLSNTSYYLHVSALNLTSVPTPPVSLGTALTSPTTAYILSKQETFSEMKLDGFSASWGNNGNSSATAYRVDVSTAENFSVLTDSKTVPDENCAFANLLIDTTYWVQVQSIGQTGLLSGFVAAGSTRTLSSSILSALALQDSIVTLETSYGQISVHLPPGSIGSSTVLTLKPSTSAFAPPLSAVSELTPTGIGLTITHYPPTLVLNAITITLPYRISDLPGGTVRSRLILALYDEANAIWVPLPSVSDTANNRVIGQTWHLSTFQIMQAHPEAGLSNVKIYPNPYRPNSVSDVMHFTNMTPYAKIKLYTFLGELVREINADVNGMAHWDGLNKSGLRVASGVYIAFIQSRDKKSSKSFKVAIER